MGNQNFSLNRTSKEERYLIAACYYGKYPKPSKLFSLSQKIKEHKIHCEVLGHRKAADVLGLEHAFQIYTHTETNDFYILLEYTHLCVRCEYYQDSLITIENMLSNDTISPSELATIYLLRCKALTGLREYNRALRILNGLQLIFTFALIERCSIHMQARVEAIKHSNYIDKWVVNKNDVLSKYESNIFNRFVQEAPLDDANQGYVISRRTFEFFV